MHRESTTCPPGPFDRFNGEKNGASPFNPLIPGECVRRPLLPKPSL
jgi:hypothetical protein